MVVGTADRDRRVRRRAGARARQLGAEQARLLERARIAQDMHDVLGHDLSLIALSAGALKGGRGLIGLDERVRLVGGSLDHGPRHRVRIPPAQGGPADPEQQQAEDDQRGLRRKLQQVPHPPRGITDRLCQ
ncbi:histidine kinase [Streptomyces globisporus]